MGVKVRIDPLAIDIPAMLSGGSRAAQQKLAAEFARDGIAKADATNARVLGRVPPRTITVDGRQNSSLESVEPDGGSIVIEWEIVGDVLIWIGQTLRDRSPVTSGAYRDGHTLYADGQPVPLTAQVPQADEYVFINLVPYARRIEVGKTEAGRAFVIQVENHIYERTAKDAAGRFGNIAKITFGYRAVQGAYALKHNQAKRQFLAGGRIYTQPTQSKDRVAGSAVPSPAIIVTYKRS